MRRFFHFDCSRPLAHQQTPCVAIVGAGPAGLYTADELLRCRLPPRQIHFFERSPLPLGLLRYGVAPDHPEVKLVSHKFQNEVLDDVAVRIFGRTHVGPGGPISLALLRKHYDAVFLCHGASAPKPLPVPTLRASSLSPVFPSPVPTAGSIPGYWSSQEAVGWYNGDIEQAHVRLNLHRVRHVVIVGMGNVALDLARIMLKDPALLESTDITRHALDELRASKVERVTIVGRRGAEHAAFATKELREMSQLPQINVIVTPPEVPTAEDRALKRLLKLLQDLAARERTPTPPARTLEFRFQSPPEALLVNDNDGGVSGLRLAGGHVLNADLVISSLGYRVSTLDPVAAPMGEHNALQQKRGKIERGLYTTGWAKRGPSGIVPSNKWDAVETVECYLEDDIKPSGKSGILLPPQGALTREQMEAIERAERQRGLGKFVTWEEMAAQIGVKV